ncbi:hypothetical protein LTR56_001223 [Elasticomyces elasticus]|nr:hypothetical protein LTR56_001223 [Elasticomyces elasticus]
MTITILSICMLAASASAAPVLQDSIVRASTGYIQGKINSNYSNVREFLNVPYGQSTAGSNRFMPPLPVPASSLHVDATDYAPMCPQYVTAVKNIWNQEIPWYLATWGNANYSAGESAVFADEDCLKLAVWTPANATAASHLPVAFFITGGGFQTNGILVPGQLPPRWVSRSQSHIVVTINYRMNILGFPNAAGIEDRNLGIMDSRLALEWVRDNIGFFGGDPGRITIWGQSAGAAAVDILQYAYWDDPIAHGSFAESGSVINSGPANDIGNSNFTFVAKNLGCDYPNDASLELQCMQKLDYNDILKINFMGQYQDNSTLVDKTQPRLSFSTVADEKIVFSNNSERYLMGKVTKAPMIYSTVANEGGSLAPFPADPSAGQNQTAANAVTINTLCGAAKSSILRNSIDLPTYRYQYAGNWTNQDPLPWMGAFHSSDLVMLFGTYADNAPAVEPLEGQTSEAMEDHLLAFVRDPWNGPATVGWPRFNTSAENGGTLLRFGADGKAVQEVDANDVQAVCTGAGDYEPFP